MIVGDQEKAAKEMMKTQARIAAAALLVTGFTPVSAAAELTTTDIAPTSNGVTVNWANSVPSYAHILQHRASPTSGTWSNVWTRYPFPDAGQALTEFAASEWATAAAHAKACYDHVLAAAATAGVKIEPQAHLADYKNPR